MTTDALPPSVDHGLSPMPSRAANPGALIVACRCSWENLVPVLATALPAIARCSARTRCGSTSPSRLSVQPRRLHSDQRLGRRPVRRAHRLRAAIGVFLLGSVLCGLSSSLPAFVAARILQGTGGSLDGPRRPAGHPALGAEIRLVSAMAYLTIRHDRAVVGPPLGGFIATICRGAGSSGSIFRSASRHHAGDPLHPAIRESMSAVRSGRPAADAIALTGLVFGFRRPGAASCRAGRRPAARRRQRARCSMCSMPGARHRSSICRCCASRRFRASVTGDRGSASASAPSRSSCDDAEIGFDKRRSNPAC